MTYKEAKDLVKERGPAKYQGRALMLLSKLTDCLYRPANQEDINGRTVSKRVETVQGWLAAVSERQLSRIIKQVEEITVMARDGRKITFMLNLNPLKDAEKSTALTTRVLQERKTNRAEKARARWAENRQGKRVADMSSLMREMRPAFYESVLHLQHEAQ